MNVNKAREYILDRLSKELRHPYLYHNVEHTIDVANAASLLSKVENIDDFNTSLIYTAALFHDSGMLKTYINHEEASVELIHHILPDFGYSTVQIDLISKMIMATKLPQEAESRFEKILCDADLDYLGRDDFFVIGLKLQYEWNQLGYKKTTLHEWYQLQINFLSAHRYFTQAANDLRELRKIDNLNQIKEICGFNPDKPH